jgi:hypothetical protein
MFEWKARLVPLHDADLALLGRGIAVRRRQRIGDRREPPRRDGSHRRAGRRLGAAGRLHAPDEFEFAADGHIATERLARALGTKFEHVSYRGCGQALMDINQDRAHLMIDAMTSSLPQVRGGTVKTPTEIGEYSNTKINEMLSDRKFVEKMFTMNVEAAPPGPASKLRDLMEKEPARWRAIASEAGIALAN